MKNRLKPIIGKWQLVFEPRNKTYTRLQSEGWHVFYLAVVKFKSLPAEGARIEKHHYSGFILTFSWWFPIDRADY